MKRNVAVLFVLAFAFLAVNFWRGLRSTDVDSARPDTAASAPQDASPAAPAAPKVMEEERSEAPAEAKVAATAQGAVQKTAEASVTLRGAFRLRERDGTERDVKTGSFELVGFSGEGVQLMRERAYADDGRWDFEIERETLARIANFTVEFPQAESRLLPLVRPGTERIVANDGKGFDVVVRDPEPCTLRVFDAVTRVELSGIEICKQCAGLQHEERHERFVLARDLASPIDALALRSTTERAIPLSIDIALRAPGYAWQEVVLDRGQGGERRVELFPGGDVEFRFNGAPLPQSASLWITAPARAGDSERISLDLQVRERANFVVCGLRELDYEAVLHVGELYDPAGRLANAKFRVVAGQRASVDIHVDPPQEVVRASLSGIAVLPAQLRKLASGKVLAISQFGNRLGEQPERLPLTCSWESEPDAPLATLRFAGEDVAVGTYALCVEGTGFSQSIELPPEGLHGLRLALGALCEVVLDVVDATSGTRVPNAQLHWCVNASAGSSGMAEWIRAERGADALFRAQVPAGEMHWLVAAEGFGEPEESGAHVAGERREFKLRLPRQCAFEFELVDGELTVPFPQSWLPELEPLGHDGETSTFSFGNTTRVIGVTRPGLYRITLPPVNGFRPPAAVEIDVAAGERKLVRIQLERN
ncbi:MAG: hypothetical protein NTV21_13545 [Planctomycetota bacterium]|nr:hypothetical protein [Planctomycetota bacterium]